MRHRFRELSAFVRRALGRHELRAFQLELAGPILIRRSEAGDRAALERLAALDSRTLPEGSFLLVEVDGELVAAAPIDVDAEPLKDPFRPTANLRELLGLQVGHVLRHRDAARLAKQRFAPSGYGLSRVGNRRLRAESSGPTDVS